MARLAHLAPVQLVVPVVAAALLLLPGRAAAADTEIRDYAIRIDGKPAGEYHMNISRQDDGTATMSGQADIKLTVYLVKTYTYSYRGTETWKDGRLLRLDSSCADDGKKFSVAALADGANLKVRANGVERTTRGESWVTTYWCLPAQAQRNRALNLVDADTGRDINAQLNYVGAAQVNVAGQALNVAHWRVTGGAQVELHYDSQERLVRQEFVEDGHRTVIELVRIRK